MAGVKGEVAPAARACIWAAVMPGGGGSNGSTDADPCAAGATVSGVDCVAAKRGGVVAAAGNGRGALVAVRVRVATEAFPVTEPPAPYGGEAVSAGAA